jgi:hypothetical protein
MNETTQSLSTEEQEVSIEQLLNSFSASSHRFASDLITDIGTIFPEGPVSRWRESVMNVDLRLVIPRRIGLAGYHGLSPGSMETVDPRLLTKDPTSEVEQFKGFKEQVVGSSRDFPVTIDDGISSFDGESTSPTETDDVDTEEIGYETRSEATYLLRYTPSESSDVQEELGLDVDEVLRDTQLRDPTPYLSTAPKPILQLSTPSRQSSNSPRLTSILTPNTLPSPPTSATSSVNRSLTLHNLQSIDNNTSRFSNNIPSLPPENATPHPVIYEYDLNETHTTISGQEDEYRPRDTSSSLSPAPSNFQPRTPPPLKIFDSVTVVRSPGTKENQEDINGLSSKAEIPKDTISDESQVSTPTDDGDDEWLPGAGKSVKSLESLRRRMKRSGPEESRNKDNKRRQSSRLNEDVNLTLHNYEQSTRSDVPDRLPWSAEDYSLLLELRNRRRPVVWREVVGRLGRDLHDIKETWRAREQWIHLLPVQLVEWDEEKVTLKHDQLNVDGPPAKII